MSTPIDDAELEGLQHVIDAATEGPWGFRPAGEYECGEPGCCYEDWDNQIVGPHGQVIVEWHALSNEDATFIRFARTAMPTLLAEVKRLRAELAAR